MTKDCFYLGPAPAEEQCAQIGDADYESRALRECRAYIKAIRAKLGEEPEGVQLRVKRESHDYGQYLEVVVEFDADKPGALAYACKCDEHAPTTWEEVGMQSPETGTGRGRA